MRQRCRAEVRGKAGCARTGGAVCRRSYAGRASPAGPRGGRAVVRRCKFCDVQHKNMGAALCPPHSHHIRRSAGEPAGVRYGGRAETCDACPGRTPGSGGPEESPPRILAGHWAVRDTHSADGPSVPGTCSCPAPGRPIPGHRPRCHPASATVLRCPGRGLHRAARAVRTVPRPETRDRRPEHERAPARIPAGCRGQGLPRLRDRHRPQLSDTLATGQETADRTAGWTASPS